LFTRTTPDALRRFVLLLREAVAVPVRVVAAMRRRGVGSRVLRELQARSASVDARGIFVETQLTNHPAISFYLRHGFGISGFNDHLYTNRDLDDQDIALFLFKELP